MTIDDDLSGPTALHGGHVTALASLFDDVASRFETLQGRVLDAEGRRRVAARIVAVTRHAPIADLDASEIRDSVLIYIRAFESAAAMAGTFNGTVTTPPGRSSGGAAYDPDTVATMSAALDRCLEDLPDRLPSSVVTALSATILQAAADGEREVAKLQARAMEQLRQRR